MPTFANPEDRERHARLVREGKAADAVEALARRMFAAYNAEPPNPGLTWDGKPVPAWEQLNDQVRGKWKAAAREALS